MTPLEKINSVYFKREDQNPTGSAKDRAIRKQIKKLIGLGYKTAVISSTGNAAISAAHFCQQEGIKLTVFVSPKINPHKLKLIDDSIVKSLKPISEAIKFSKTNNAYLLRQSTDPVAITGYQEIGQEILKQLPQVSSIFVPTGSGTTLLGITEALPKNIKIFAVQSAYNPTLAPAFKIKYPPETKNLTDALTVKYLPLKTKIVTTLKKHQSFPIIVTNSEIISAQKLISTLHLSSESALALAAYLQVKDKFSIGNFPVIICTGTRR